MAISTSIDVERRPADVFASIEVDFAGHGIGQLLVPRPQARREMPANVKRPKQRLEASTESTPEG
ncbi:MAG: hypothetical protein ACRDRJ_00255 [Streptosporangiaceae bacterium]